MLLTRKTGLPLLVLLILLFVTACGAVKTVTVDGKVKSIETLNFNCKVCDNRYSAVLIVTGDGDLAKKGDNLKIAFTVDGYRSGEVRVGDSVKVACSLYGVDGSARACYLSRYLSSSSSDSSEDITPLP